MNEDKRKLSGFNKDLADIHELATAFALDNDLEPYYNINKIEDNLNCMIKKENKVNDTNYNYEAINTWLKAIRGSNEILTNLKKVFQKMITKPSAAAVKFNQGIYAGLNLKNIDYINEILRKNFYIGPPDKYKDENNFSTDVKISLNDVKWSNVPGKFENATGRIWRNNPSDIVTKLNPAPSPSNSLNKLRDIGISLKATYEKGEIGFSNSGVCATIAFYFGLDGEIMNYGTQLTETFCGTSPTSDIYKKAVEIVDSWTNYNDYVINKFYEIIGKPGSQLNTKYRNELIKEIEKKPALKSQLAQGQMNQKIQRCLWKILMKDKSTKNESLSIDFQANREKANLEIRDKFYDYVRAQLSRYQSTDHRIIQEPTFVEFDSEIDDNPEETWIEYVEASEKFAIRQGEKIKIKFENDDGTPGVEEIYCMIDTILPPKKRFTKNNSGYAIQIDEPKERYIFTPYGIEGDPNDRPKWWYTPDHIICSENVSSGGGKKSKTDDYPIEWFKIPVEKAYQILCGGLKLPHPKPDKDVQCIDRESVPYLKVFSKSTELDISRPGLARYIKKEFIHKISDIDYVNVSIQRAGTQGLFLQFGTDEEQKKLSDKILKIRWRLKPADVPPCSIKVDGSDVKTDIIVYSGGAKTRRQAEMEERTVKENFQNELKLLFDTNPKYKNLLDEFNDIHNDNILNIEDKVYIPGNEQLLKDLEETKNNFKIQYALDYLKNDYCIRNRKERNQVELTNLTFENYLKNNDLSDRRYDKLSENTYIIKTENKEENDFTLIIIEDPVKKSGLGEDNIMEYFWTSPTGQNFIEENKEINEYSKDLNSLKQSLEIFCKINSKAAKLAIETMNTKEDVDTMDVDTNYEILKPYIINRSTFKYIWMWFRSQPGWGMIEHIDTGECDPTKLTTSGVMVMGKKRQLTDSTPRSRSRRKLSRSGSGMKRSNKYRKVVLLKNKTKKNRKKTKYRLGRKTRGKKTKKNTP